MQIKQCIIDCYIKRHCYFARKKTFCTYFLTDSISDPKEQIQITLSLTKISFGFPAQQYLSSLGALWSTVQILCIGTDRSQQTVQTKIRLLLKKQSDQGLLCLPFHQHLLDALMHCYIKLFFFRTIMAIQILEFLRYLSLGLASVLPKRIATVHCKINTCNLLTEL